jgi:hypothetical protein
VGIASYIESNPVDLGEGDQFMFVSRIRAGHDIQELAEHAISNPHVEGKGLPR